MPCFVYGIGDTSQGMNYPSPEEDVKYLNNKIVFHYSLTIIQ